MQSYKHMLIENHTTSVFVVNTLSASPSPIITFIPCQIDFGEVTLYIEVADTYNYLYFNMNLTGESLM